MKLGAAGKTYGRLLGMKEPGPSEQNSPGMETKTMGMERTTKGLRAVLLDEIDNLREGKTSEGHAHAIARLANAAISAVRLEMDAYDFIARNEDRPKSIPKLVPALDLVA